jgi:hypothetical protein
MNPRQMAASCLPIALAANSHGLFRDLNAAREMEVELAIGLREEGYGVWQA